MALADADRLDEAKDAYAQALEESEELGSAWLRPDMLMLSGELRFLAGDWDDATAELEPGLLLAAQHGQRISINQSRAYQAVVATARGNLAAAKAALTSVADQLNADAPWYGAEMVAFAAALVAEAEGDESRAFQALRRSWQYDLEREIRYYHRYLGPVLVRFALTLGQADLAHDVVAVMEDGAALAPEVPTVVCAALRCRGLLEGDPEPLLEASRAGSQGRTGTRSRGYLRGRRRRVYPCRSTDGGEAAPDRGTVQVRRHGCHGMVGTGRRLATQAGRSTGRAGSPSPGGKGLGESHRKRTVRLRASGPGSDQPTGGPTSAHLAAHREHTSSSCLPEAFGDDSGGAGCDDRQASRQRQDHAMSVAMRKSPLVARSRSPLVASESPHSSFVVS